jgi:hypothetical protein
MLQTIVAEKLDPIYMYPTHHASDGNLTQRRTGDMHRMLSLSLQMNRSIY